MKLAVHIKGLRYADRGELRDVLTGRGYGIPVLVFRGKALGIAELPPRSRIEVTWRKARTGAMWNLIERAINAGYPIDIDIEPVG